MLKKYLIISLLMFAYAIVLGHNIIPHGHFAEIFSTEHHHDIGNQGLSDHDNNQDHDYPFSHNVSLHFTFEKQNVYSYQSVKAEVKKFCSSADYILKNANPIIVYCKTTPEFQDFVFRHYETLRKSFYSRPPPAILS